MYSKDETLTTPESLKGKTIAGPTGTNLHELLVSYLAQADMTLDDVNYVNMTIPDAKAGLDGGSVDVALIAGATAYNAEQQGYHSDPRNPVAIASKESPSSFHLSVYVVIFSV